MAAFVYFIPGSRWDQFGKDVDVRDAVVELGLDYAFDHRIQPRSVHNSGPNNGGSGMLLYDDSRVPMKFAKVSKADDAQQWRKVHGKDAWIGWRTDEHKPKPSDLIRTVHFDQNKLTRLGDGATWEVPVMAMWDFGETPPRLKCSVPRDYRLDDETGRWTISGLHAKYQPVWDIAAGWYDVRFDRNHLPEDDGPVRISFEDVPCLDHAVKIISLNYRVSAWELDIMGALLGDAAVRVLDATIQMAEIKEHVKKNLDRAV